jgi:hypothetical protein
MPYLCYGCLRIVLCFCFVCPRLVSRGLFIIPQSVSARVFTSGGYGGIWMITRWIWGYMDDNQVDMGVYGGWKDNVISAWVSRYG